MGKPFGQARYFPERGNDMYALDSGSSVIEALPAVFGFTPVDSLIAISVGPGGDLRSALRLDLADALGDVASTAERFAYLVERHGGVSAVVVVVSREGALCPVCAESYGEMVAALKAALAECDAEVSATYVVDRVEAGGRWRGLDGDGGGVLADPTTSPLAAERVASGHVQYKDRAEMGTVTASDHDRAAVLAPLLAAAGPVVSVSQSVRTVLDAVRRVAEGEDLADAELAAIGATLTDLQVRDRLAVALAGSGESPGAGSLWAVLARCLPQPWRAEALGLFALCAYVRGDAVLAAATLESSLREAPEHRLSRLLDLALEAGLSPTEIREGLAGMVLSPTS